MKKIVLSTKEIYEIEKLTQKKYGISNLILMENAGRATAELIKRLFENLEDKKIVVICGKGNNGGDGFVTARYLFNWGANVKVYFMGNPEEFKGISFTNFNILCKMCISVSECGKIDKKVLEGADLIVDGILGVGLKGEVRGEARDLIKKVNESKKKVVSIDIPSGLNADTGEIMGEAVKADITVSFGFAKKGFYTGEGPQVCGEIEIVDIGYPRYFYEKYA